MVSIANVLGAFSTHQKHTILKIIEQIQAELLHHAANQCPMFENQSRMLFNPAANQCAMFENQSRMLFDFAANKFFQINGHRNWETRVPDRPNSYFQIWTDHPGV